MPLEVAHVAVELHGVARGQQGTDVLPVGRQQRTPAASGASTSHHDERDHHHQRAGLAEHGLNTDGGQRHRGSDQGEAGQKPPRHIRRDRADESGGQRRDPGNHDRESQDHGDPPPRRSGRRVGEHHRGDQVPTDQSREQQEPDQGTSPVRRRKGSDDRGRVGATHVLRSLCEPPTDVHLAEEALRGNGDQRVAGLPGDIAPVDLTGHRRGGEVRLRAVGDQIQGVLLPDGLDHRG